MRKGRGHRRLGVFVQFTLSVGVSLGIKCACAGSIEDWLYSDEKYLDSIEV